MNTLKYLLKPEVSDTQKLESQMAVSHLTWVLGIKLGSSGRTTVVLSCWGVSAAPKEGS